MSAYPGIADQQAATDLYAKSPLKVGVTIYRLDLSLHQVRYTIKFNPKTGLLVLKITDDTTVSAAFCVAVP